MTSPVGEVGRHEPHNTIDRFIGMRIRERRTVLGMSQHELAQALGIEPPALSKCELGEISVSAPRLYEVARLLSTSPDYFFDGFEDHHPTELPAKQRRLLSFMRSVSEIGCGAHQELVHHLVRGLAGRE